MSIKAKVASLRDILGNVDELRFPLADSEGAALAREIGADNLEHPTVIADALARIDALGDAPAVTDTDALAKWALAHKQAHDLLWSGLEGAVVDGVIVIRRR